MSFDNCESDDCVCEVIGKIIDAQEEAVKNKRCISSCETSIKQLLSRSSANMITETTVPFILSKKGSLEPYIARGIFRAPIEGYPKETFFDYLETPVLRAKKFVENKKCCVVFELLRPVNANGFPVADNGENLSDFFQRQTPHKTVNFRETGICITLDLDCFCGITCLDAITPLPPLQAF